IGFRLISSICMIVIVIVIAPIISFDKETAYLIVILGLSRCFESMSDICYGEMQKQERIDYVGISKILRGLLTIFVFYLLIKLINNLVLATLGLAFCWFLILLIYDIPRTKEYVPVKVNFILSHLKVILITALPLAFFQLLLSLN